MKILLAALFLLGTIGAFSENYEESLEQVEIWIDKNCKPSSFVEKSYRKKLSAIFDSQETEKVKIEKLHQQFPKAFSDVSFLLQTAKCYDSEKNHKEAIKWYLKAATNNNTQAQLTLGLHYSEGKGCVRNNGEAMKWYHAAAEQGLAEAQFLLGEV